MPSVCVFTNLMKVNDFVKKGLFKMSFNIKPFIRKLYKFIIKTNMYHYKN